MHAFIERLAGRIEQAETHSIADSLADAGEILRMWRFFKGNPSSLSDIERRARSEETDLPPVASDDIDLLKRALVVFVERHPQHTQMSGAVHALYCLAAPDTKGLLVSVLRDCIGRDSAALYQTILALEALGDNLYGSRSSTSVEEVDRNEKVARDYLKSSSATH